MPYKSCLYLPLAFLCVSMYKSKVSLLLIFLIRELYIKQAVKTVSTSLQIQSIQERKVIVIRLLLFRRRSRLDLRTVPDG